MCEFFDLNNLIGEYTYFKLKSISIGEHVGLAIKMDFDQGTVYSENRFTPQSGKG